MTEQVQVSKGNFKAKWLIFGFSETDLIKEAQRLGAGAYVKKPYVMEKIGVGLRFMDDTALFAYN